MKRIVLNIAIILLILSVSPMNASAAKTNRGIGLTIKTKTGTEISLYKESHALVIGVSEYTNAWPKLPGVKKDVAVVSKALRKNGFHVVVVEDPNQRELENAFSHFILDYGLDPDNRLLFYFAGHGYTLKPNYAMDDPEEWMGYIGKGVRDELGNLLQSIGYREVNKGKTGGSRRRFIHPSAATITLHKPHPQNVLKRYAMDQVLDVLRQEGLI